MLGSPNLDHRCNRPCLWPLLFWGWFTLISNVKFNLRVKIYPILSLWTCALDNSPQIEVRIFKFGPIMHLITVKVPIDFWDWLTLILSFMFNFQPVIFYQTLHLLFICTVLYVFRLSSACVPHPTWLRTYTDSYALGQGPAIDRETVYSYISVRSLEVSQPRLGDWHWILQAAFGLRPIIYASHAELLYANIRQSPKRQ